MQYGARHFAGEKVQTDGAPIWLKIRDFIWYVESGQATGPLLFQPAEFIEKVSPDLHQLNSFGPILGTIVDTANFIFVLMPESSFNCICVMAARIEDGAGR